MKIWIHPFYFYENIRSETNKNPLKQLSFKIFK